MLLQLSSNFQDLISTKYNVNLLLCINTCVFRDFENMIMYKILHQLGGHDGMFSGFNRNSIRDQING